VSFDLILSLLCWRFSSFFFFFFGNLDLRERIILPRKLIVRVVVEIEDFRRWSSNLASLELL
jgi:hypothetical protein